VRLKRVVRVNPQVVKSSPQACECTRLHATINQHAKEKGAARKHDVCFRAGSRRGYVNASTVGSGSSALRKCHSGTMFAASHYANKLNPTFDNDIPRGLMTFDSPVAHDIYKI
jgi:hypothetical protein